MLTTLDIINAMLASTGTRPLTSNDTRHPAYTKALNKLEHTSREVQKRGWWFNASRRVMRPNTSGEVILPGRTLHADPVDRTSGIVIRGRKLYDLPNATYNIGTEIAVRYVELLPIEELPAPAADYIKSRAVYDYFLDEDGAAGKLGEYKAARDMAWVEFKDEHLKNADINYFDGTSAQALRRRGGPVRLPLRDTGY